MIRRAHSAPLAALCLAALALPLRADRPQTVAHGPQVIRAVRHDVSATLDRMARPAVPAAQFEKEVKLRKPPDKGKPDQVGPPDPKRQTDTRPIPQAAATPQPSLAFEGLSDDDNAAIAGGRIVPPDTEGDVGVDYYVQWINLVFAIYDKATGAIAPGGGPFAGNAIWSGFGGLCESTNDGDPIVLYDHLAGRWLFTQFAVDPGSGTIEAECVALSTGGDPRGPYDRWEFDLTPLSAEEADYPKFGLMPEAYYVSSRDFPASAGSFAGAGAFDRAAMLAGDPSPAFIKFNLPCASGDCPDAIQPVHLEGPAPGAGTHGFFVRAWDDDFDGPLTGADGYRIWELVPDFATPGNSTFTELPFVVGSPYDSTMCGFFQRNCIQQPSPGERVDPIDELQMYRAQYRSFPDRDSIVINTTVDASGSNVAGIRWAELRDTGSGWTLHQDGTYAPADGLHRWMGSAAMDGDGNIALGYSVSSSSVFPGVRYTSREAGDPPGTMPGGEVELVAGSSVQTGSFNRWGDYSTMSVDPVDDCTFWFTQEYQRDDGDGSTAFDFKTRIGRFKIPSCGGGGGPVCGDGQCEAGEDCFNCAADCEIQLSGASCGNGVCEAGNGEDCLSCPQDCNGKQNGRPANRFCCGDGDGQNPVTCSDARCTSGGFACTSVPVGGGTACCGDSFCDPAGETCGNCALDCTQGASELVCDDGIDDDCDGLFDCDDADCSADPACQGGGSCTLGQSGDPCAVDAAAAPASVAARPAR